VFTRFSGDTYSQIHSRTDTPEKKNASGTEGFRLLSADRTSHISLLVVIATAMIKHWAVCLKIYVKKQTSEASGSKNSDLKQPFLPLEQPC